MSRLAAIAALVLFGQAASAQSPDKPAASMPAPLRPPIVLAPPRRTFDVTLSPDRKALHVIGRFDSGLTRRFKQLARENPQARVVVLSSIGGTLVEGVAMAEAIRAQGMSTDVEMLCASACTFAFLAGRERTVAPTAALGFHGSANLIRIMLSPNDDPSDPAGNEVMRSVYLDAGLSPSFIEQAIAVPTDDLWLPETAILLREAVVTRLAKPGEFQAVAGPWASVAAFEAVLNKEAFWLKVKAANPMLYSMATLLVWEQAGLGSKDPPATSARKMLITLLLSRISDFDDALVGDYIALEKDIWAARTEVLNRDCPNMRAFPVGLTGNAALTLRQDQLITRMLEAKPAASPPDAKRRTLAQADVNLILGELIAKYDYTPNAAMGSICSEPLQFFETLQAKPLARRLRLIRSIVMQFLPRRQGQQQANPQ